MIDSNFERLSNIRDKEKINRYEEIEKFFNIGVDVKLGWNIYIYNGFFRRDIDHVYDYRFDYRCYDIEQADYVLYKNLVNNLCEKYIEPKVYEGFEQDKIIIKFNNYQFPGCKYHRLRKFYLNKLLDGMDEEDILKMIEEDKEKFCIRSIDRCKMKSSKVRVLSRGDNDE